MVAVLDPTVLTGFRNGLLSVSAEDDEVYLIADDGAIPMSGARGLTTLEGDQLTPIGADWARPVSSSLAIEPPTSPAEVGTTVFEGRLQGTHHGESGKMFVGNGTGLARANLKPAWVEPGANLDLDFVNNRYWHGEYGAVDFAEIIDYTGDEDGTYFNSDGVQNQASASLPRLEYRRNSVSGLWEPAGLLSEPLATNLLVGSEAFDNWSSSNTTVAANTSSAPDGNTTADTITASLAGGYTSRNVTFTGDGTKSVSIFVKAGTSASTAIQLRDTTHGLPRAYVRLAWSGGVPTPSSVTGTLEIEANGNGWYRLKFITTSVTAAGVHQLRIQPDTVAGTGSVIVWGAQAEDTPLATSFIPTTNATVTRAADVALITGRNFATFFNPTGEGTFVFEGRFYGYVANQRVFQVSPEATGNMLAWYSATGQHRLRVTNGTTTTAVGLNQAPASGTTFKEALSFGLSEQSISVNGAAPVSINATLPADLAKLCIGCDVAGNNQMQGTLARLTYFPQYYSGSALQARSAL